MWFKDGHEGRRTASFEEGSAASQAPCFASPHPPGWLGYLLCTSRVLLLWWHSTLGRSLTVLSLPSLAAAYSLAVCGESLSHQLIWSDQLEEEAETGWRSSCPEKEDPVSGSAGPGGAGEAKRGTTVYVCPSLVWFLIAEIFQNL